MLINVKMLKMLTTVDILTFITMINLTSESLKAKQEKSLIISISVFMYS